MSSPFIWKTGAYSDIHLISSGRDCVYLYASSLITLQYFAAVGTIDVMLLLLPPGVTSEYQPCENTGQCASPYNLRFLQLNTSSAICFKKVKFGA